MIAAFSGREEPLEPSDLVGGAADQPVSERIVDYIERNYASPISLRDVASVFGYSACHLTHTFRESTGLPITAWIIRRRIVAAQALLASNSVDVATACERVGFNDLCYFTRQFVRYVGTTPGRFRSAMNGAPQAREDRASRRVSRGSR